MKKITLAVGSLILASAAVAGEHPRFQWSPEDLATPERIAETHGRIEALAGSICRDRLNGTRSLRLWGQCMSVVEDEIVTGIGDRRLTAYARTGSVEDNLLSAINP